MCTTCGCGSGEARIDADGGTGLHVHADGVVHAHPHRGRHEHGGPAHGHACGEPDAVALDAHDPARATGTAVARRLRIERDILSKNDALAAANRARLAALGILALNLVSSPGSGKTTLLVRTIEALRGRRVAAVIEGDQQTSLDAERIRATGAAAVQVNTGRGCHLDADMVSRAIARLAPAPDSLLFIENVGNLVCPAAFDLGEAHTVVVLSVTEGEDKPLKYPDLFRRASLMLLNKSDLLPHLDYDRDAAIACARRVNPALQVLQVSARTGEGFGDWLAWLDSGAAGAARTR